MFLPLLSTSIRSEPKSTAPLALRTAGGWRMKA